MKAKYMLIVPALAMAMLTSCHSSRHTVRGSTGHRGDRDVPVAVSSHPGDETPSDNASALIKEARQWLGTPYRYGGNTRDGADCSGFVCAVFDRVTGVKLPRSSREQADYCKHIDRNKLRPGDLIFFTSQAGGSRINHVAIYIGDNSIIHSTSSRGVVVSSLDERYWSSHYHCCGRVTAAKL